MRFFPNSSRAIWLSGIAAILAATLACQTAQKNTFLPPTRAQAPALLAASTPPSTSEQQPAAQAEPPSKPQRMEVDPVADLIASVEKEYQSGQENYQAGHLEAAKQNFDNA